MMKKILYIISLFLVCLTVCYAKEDYRIDKYKVEISVNSDNNIDVKEDVSVSFHKLKGTLKKELPYNVMNLKINTDYDVETTNKKVVSIDNNGVINPLYSLTYTLPNSNHDNYDIDIINSYDSTILETEFVVNLPSSITKDNISFVYEGEDVTDDVNYKIVNNKITGTYKKALMTGDKITLKGKYKQVYVNSLNLLVLILPIVLTIISYLIWYRYGKDLNVNIVKSANLPKELTPLDIALVQNENVKDDDMFGFLIYMANKGYIKIIEEKSNEFYLERVKDYDGDNYQEEVFLKSLFKKTLKVSLSEYIDLVSAKEKIEKEEVLENKIDNNELSYRYRRVLTNLLPVVNNDEEKSVYYELESDKKKNILVFFVAFILILITLVPFIEINNLSLFPLSIIYSVVSLKVLVTLVDYIDINELHKKRNKYYLVISIIVVFIICFILLVPSFRRNLIYSVAFLISLLSVLVILVLYKYMPKRTLYGSRVYAKIEGLKIFIDTCDKESLDLVTKKNKSYLYDLLGYSYVLGNTNKVVNLFKMSEVKKPSWYKLKSEFSVMKFFNSLNRLKSNLSNKDVN